MIEVLEKILAPRWKPLWPSEFHICGNDSEPLQSAAVLSAIDFLLERKRIVELITNGLLLDKPDIISAVARIDKLSISLDVTNDDDYRKYKLPEGSTIDGYTKVLENMRKVEEHRKKVKSSLKISATFVATPKTFDKEQNLRCFEELKEAGVRRIRVRDDLFKVCGIVTDLGSQVGELNEKIKGVDIKYISPDNPYSEFKYCRGPRLWPALAVDGCLYACAHVANSKYQPFGDLMTADSLIELYQELFQPPRKNFISVSDIGCHRQCPSMLGRYNEPSLAKVRLGRKYYV